MATNDDSGSYRDQGAVPFEEVARIFDLVRELTASEREAVLTSEAGEGTPLRREVDRLLGLHEAKSGVLDEDHASVDPSAALDALEEQAPDSGNWLPEKIGGYRVEKRLGRGGMGQVFLGVREGDDFHKRVAIKVLRPGVDDPDLLRRFRSERRILAHLEHPNIATLIDGGTMEDGRPYVVMEHVEGVDLIRFARESNLNLRARLQLFVKVCNAVEYAHRNLVVHRDLKPSNILVTPDGEPKLLDFGIAKLLDHERTEHSVVHTSTGMALFTPEYASPEQVLGGTITTATDVYSLGAMLYELLTDVRAHRLTTRRPAEVERVVCEDPPTTPSEASTEAMARRWRRGLTGDLDNITLMALRKEPERRYGSVAELSEDLRRHLQGLPVRARKDTLSYRTAKFVRRNALWVSAAAILAVLLSAFAIVMAVQAKRIAQQRDIAEREGEIASQVSDFLVSLFAVSDPTESAGEQVLARTVLDRGARTISHELSSGPQVRAKLMETMGRAYMSLGLFEESRPLLDGALELRRSGGDEAATAGAEGLLGSLERFQGDYPEAERLMRACIETLAAVDPDSDAGAEAKAQLASLLTELGRSEEALELAVAANRTWRRLHPAPHRAIAAGLGTEAYIRQALGQFEDAERIYRESLAMQEELFGPSHPVCARTHNMIADLLKGLSRFDEAVVHIEKALAIDREVLGEEHPDTNNDRFGLAQLIENMGDFARAEELYRQILAHDQRQYGDEHPYVALDLSAIAGACNKQGKFDEAEALFQEALEMQYRVLPGDAPEIATTLSNLGVLYRNSRQFEKARSYMEEALAIREQIFPADHPTVLTARNMVAVTLTDQGRYAEAEEIQLEILEARREKLGDHPHVAGSHFSVAVARRRAGDIEGALHHYRESIRVYEATLPGDHVDLARPLNALGKTLAMNGEPEAGRVHLERALAIQESALPEDHLDLALTRRQLGWCLAALGEEERVDELLQAALTVYTTRLGPTHVSTTNCRADYVSALELLGRLEDAQRVRSGG